ncbi:hypothetical protein BDFB_014550, partial [Asbolus verrucosus]
MRILLQENMQLDFLIEHIQDQMCFCDLSVERRTMGSLKPTKKVLLRLNAMHEPTPQNKEVEPEAFNEDPTTNIRVVAHMVDGSRSIIQMIMRDNRQHAYHYKRVQNLMPEDYPAKVNF